MSRALGASFSASFGDSWGTDAAPQPTTDGPWRLLSGEPQKARKRKMPRIDWPADWPPAEPSIAPASGPAARVEVAGDLTFREIIGGELEGLIVPRGTEPDLKLALALLLAV